MPDEIDRATENAAFLLEARIKEQRRNAHPHPNPLPEGEGKKECDDCGDVIPEMNRMSKRI